MKQIRLIEVNQCGVGFCPYCIPDGTKESINYCGAFLKPRKIASRVKTFPRICPLKAKNPNISRE